MTIRRFAPFLVPLLALTGLLGRAAAPAVAAPPGGGDIPDNQIFLVYRSASARYSIRFPEGWARHGAGSSVTFVNNYNTVRVQIGKGALPTAAAVRNDLHGAKITSQPSRVTLPGGPAVKVVYQAKSPPNQVTGKSLPLMVDRYYVTGSRGRRAVIDLATPIGVDNVDAYRLIARSFHWS